MNGTERQVEIFKPFGEAFELTKKILFQPFDITKWFVIGFAAFLSNFSGGLNFNFNARSLKNIDWHTYSFNQNATIDSSNWPVWAIPLIVVIGLFVIAFVVVLLWIGARGRFIFTDCIVRNRGAIIEPWRKYRVEGNSFFFFSLLVGLIGLVVVVLAALPVVIPAMTHETSGVFAVGMTFGLIFLVTIIVLLALGWSLLSQLMVPVMYRQRCRAVVAFREVLALFSTYPGPLVLYFLFFLVLIIAAAMIGCVSVCLTCCITAIPYVGTVILLPLPVLLHSFTLLFVRQFGPDYDVWGNVAPSEPPPPPSQALPA